MWIETQEIDVAVDTQGKHNIYSMNGKKNSTRCCGDCTQEAKNETTVNLAEAKNYLSDFFTDVEY